MHWSAAEQYVWFWFMLAKLQIGRAPNIFGINLPPHHGKRQKRNRWRSRRLDHRPELQKNGGQLGCQKLEKCTDSVLKLAETVQEADAFQDVHGSMPKQREQVAITCTPPRYVPPQLLSLQTHRASQGFA